MRCWSENKLLKLYTSDDEQQFDEKNIQFEWQGQKIINIIVARIYNSYIICHTSEMHKLYICKKDVTCRMIRSSRES
jgi:hypothetical protein